MIIASLFWKITGGAAGLAAVVTFCVVAARHTDKHRKKEVEGADEYYERHDDNFYF